LDEKIAEGERTIQQLLVDKKTLQTALANDSDQRNQMLTKEINSLQTALEFKSSEMKELRQKYQQVALRVEEIPVKELEITKLKHKVIELKQALDQKLTYEKKVILSLLVHQNEELKRQQLAIEEERESMQRNFDVMIYRYGNGEELEASPRPKPQLEFFSGKVQFRSRSSNSDRSQSNAREMDHSMDRDSLVRSTISMYASQVQLPENHADDVIYAPDEIITGNGDSRAAVFITVFSNSTSSGLYAIMISI
uniref:Liprin-beta-2 n=1 Tax=Angiostrongylus cantonensis TaxID=6313 RepID=A0A158PAA0_ANGCA